MLNPSAIAFPMCEIGRKAPGAVRIDPSSNEEIIMFRNREHAAELLAQRLSESSYRDPLVVAVSPGGVVTAGVIAEALGAELDLLQTRSLRAPDNPNRAIGSISETGDVHLNRNARRYVAAPGWIGHLENERSQCLADIREMAGLLHQVRAPAHVCGRSVIVVADGVNTGATLLVALKTAMSMRPFELIAATPVLAADALEVVKERCDELFYLNCPDSFAEVREFYEHFEDVDQKRVCDILRCSLERRKRAVASERPLLRPRDNDIQLPLLQ